MNNFNVIRCYRTILGLALCLPLSPLKATQVEITAPVPGEEVNFIAPNVPDCSGTKVVKDTWLLHIPESDLALRSDLFTILNFMSFKGFGVNTVPSESTDEVNLFIYFNEKAFLVSDGTEKTVDIKSAQLVKTKILQGLASVINPTLLSCVKLAPPPLHVLEGGAEMAAAMGKADAPGSVDKSACSIDNIAACIDPERAGGVTGSNGCRINDPRYTISGDSDNWSTEMEERIRKLLEK